MADQVFKECADFGVCTQENDRTLHLYYDVSNYRTLTVQSPILDWRWANGRMIIKCEDHKILIFTDDFSYASNQMLW